MDFSFTQKSDMIKQKRKKNKLLKDTDIKYLNCIKKELNKHYEEKYKQEIIGDFCSSLFNIFSFHKYRKLYGISKANILTPNYLNLLSFISSLEKPIMI